MNIEEVVNLPIEKIHILNPRLRDRINFEQLVDSIRKNGLKKPVTVSTRRDKQGKVTGYDLVCGQGRIEALQLLKYTVVPAIVIEIPKTECLLMGLVENIARHSPVLMDLLNEMERLKSLGCNFVEIGRRLGISPPYVADYLKLKNAGEERVLRMVLEHKLPISIGMDIAGANSTEEQSALLKAYEEKRLNGHSIRIAKRLMERRNYYGKGLGKHSKDQRAKRRLTAEQLVDAAQKECKRQKLYVRNARACADRLAFVQRAFRQLLEDAQFVGLLKAQSLDDLPAPLAKMINFQN
jgi:ParB family chromosome partitioning protein